MITTAQKLARATRAGSSDAPAILGVDDYRTIADCWLEKTGRVEPFKGNDATRRGQLLQPALLGFASSVLQPNGGAVHAEVEYIHPSDLLIAHVDGVLAGGEQIIECKTTVLTEGWGYEGTSQIPNNVLVQVAHQFACVSTARICWVPVLMPGFRSLDFKLFKVERDDDMTELVNTVAEAGIEFIDKYVKLDIPPDNYRPSLDVLKRVKRVPNSTKSIDGELVAAWNTKKHAAKLAKDAVEESQAAVIAALGDAEAGDFDGGQVTYLEVNRKAYECAATTFRQLKLKTKK